MYSLIIGGIIYNVFTYGAFLAGGKTIQYVWDTYRLFPVITSHHALPWYSMVLWYVGIACFYFSFMWGQTALSKVVYEQLRGDEFYEMSEAIKFANSNLKTIIFSPITLLGAIIFLLLVGALMGLIGRIPYFGPIFIGLVAILIFFFAFFTVYLMVVFILSLIYTPYIIGTTKSDTFDTLFELFSILWEEPWRIVVYNSIIVALSSLGVLIFGFFVKFTMHLTYNVMSIWAGGSGYLAKMWANAWYFIPPVPSSPVTDAITATTVPSLLITHDWVGGNWGIIVGGILLGIAFYIAGLLVLSYFFASFGSGQTLIYLILAYKKDERNLLEIKENLFEEEPVEDIVKNKEEEEKEEDKEENKESEENKD